MGWVSNPRVGVLRSRQGDDIEQATGRKYTLEDVGTSQAATRSHQEPPGAKRGKGAFSPQILGGAMAMLTP